MAKGKDYKNFNKSILFFFVLFSLLFKNLGYFTDIT